MIAVVTRINGGHATIDVSDDGGTLPLEFEIERSTGLGLSLAGALAEQIRGSFGLQCRDGRTTARLSFPLAV